MLRIAVIPGDGIGVEVTREAVKVLQTVASCAGKPLTIVEFDFGAEKFLREGVSLPHDTLDRFRAEFDAILLGALGDPRLGVMVRLYGQPDASRFSLSLGGSLWFPIGAAADRAGLVAGLPLPPR